MSQYQHEYETTQLNSLLEDIIVWFDDTLYEEYHVIKAIEECANDIAQQIANRFKNLTLIQRVNETYFPTGWYIKSKLPKSNIDIERTVLTKIPTNHQILFSFQKMKSDIDMQNLKRPEEYSQEEIEQICKQVFEEDMKEDDPKIIISFQFMYEKVSDASVEILKALLSHEMRHVIDQYIVEIYNTMNSKQNSLFSDFKQNNIFDLNVDTKMYRELFDLFYYMSAEEQRARVQATWSMCQNIVQNKSFKTQLTASYNKVMQYRYGHNRKEMDDNFRIYIIAVIRMMPFKYVHKLSFFRKIINNLFVRQFSSTYKSLLIIGYFMFKHNYMYVSTSYGEKVVSDVREFFSEQNVRRKLYEPYSKDDEEYYIIVFKSVNKNYSKYQNIIYNTIGNNIKKLFRISRDGFSTADEYNKLGADNDLKLTDFEVGVINESFNLYQYTFERFLLGLESFY